MDYARNHSEHVIIIVDICNMKTNENNTTMSEKKSWRPVTIGGFTGILMGAGTMYAYQSYATNGEEPTATEGEAVTSQTVNIPVEEAVPSDDLSFEQAFAAARADVGPGGVFRWHGNIYNTYTVDEWNNIPQPEKQHFAQRVSPEVPADEVDTRLIADDVQTSDNQPDYEYADAVDVADMEQPNVAPDKQPATSDDDDVRVVGFGHVEMANGHTVAVEEVDINGQRVAIIDVDQDGVGDIAMSDANHNQQADEGEIIDLHTGEPLSLGQSSTEDIDAGMETDDSMMAEDNNLEASDAADIPTYSI